MKRRLFVICLFIGFNVQAQQFSQRFELVKLGTEVNTFYHEAAPVISPDGKDLYFFVQNHPENTYGKENTQDIWVSHKDEKGWTQAKRMGSPLNQNHANQVFGVLPDGSLFVRGGRSKDEVGFSIVPRGGSLIELKILGFKDMMKGKFYGATMSSDKRHMVLYFSEAAASTRSDLYVSHVQPDGDWTRPVKLNITDGSDEFGPFLSPDDKFLYYASDRNDPNRQGRSDIYRSERMDDTWNKWAKPVNLKRPVNTAAVDSYFTIDAQGNVYTSRANSRVDGGNLDIFALVPKVIKVMVAGTVYNDKTKSPIGTSDVVIEMPDNSPLTLKANAGGKFESHLPEVEQFTVSASASGFLPSKETFTVPHIMNDTTLQADLYLVPIAQKLYLTGTVFDKKTEQPVTAKVDVVFKPESKNVMKLTATDGRYEKEITKKGWYVLNASAEGYLNGADSIRVEDTEGAVTKDIYLQPIEVGLTVRLKNIYFDFDKATLKSESFIELDKVVDFLRTNSRVEVEIAGHTDNKGSDEYNANLSQGRSQSVVDYLISKGISVSRLTAHGYGESKPIDTNETKDGQANNRRVEFTVVKN